MIGIFILFIISLLIILFLIKKRKALYNYDVKKDYIYDMRSADEVFDINIQNKKIINSIKDVKYDTGMLEIHIASTLLGEIKQPYIIIKQGENKFYQYFEYGAKGKRYLNIPKCIDFENKINLETNNCNIIKQNSKLFLFNNEIDLDENICIIAPHPDDAEIAAYGLYSSCENVYVLNISASESGKTIYKGLDLSLDEQSIIKGKTRVINSLSVPLLAGVKANNCINYSYFGDTLSDMYLQKNTIIESKIKSIANMKLFRDINHSTLIRDSYESSWNSLVEDLKYSLQKIKADTFVLPFPMIDTHPDHKYSTLAVLEAIKSLGIKKGKLLLYTNHHILSESYPYGLENSSILLPPNFSEELEFDSIYSFELDKSKQIEKKVALEGMNVLRIFFPWNKNITILNRVFKNIINKIYGKRLDYFSRSVRSNELFFVVDIKNIDKLLLA